MDEIGGLLDGPRARGAFLLRMVMEPPWAVRIQDDAPLAVVAVTRGEAHLRFDDGTVHTLRRGDLAITAAAPPYVFADAPATPAQVVILPGQRCTTPDGAPADAAAFFDTRAWGRAGGATEALIGVYEAPGSVGGRLLAALPPVLTLPGFGLDTPMLAVLDAEIGRAAPGQEVVLDRSLDLVLVAALRAWFDRPDAQVPGWYAAAGDPVVGPALRAMQQGPAENWTVAALAARSQVSRAALARRFTELVGVPPMAWLAGWRLDLAADLLRDTDATLDAVARRVGYGSGFALSAAFKRVHGISPREHREIGQQGIQHRATRAPVPATT